LERPCDWLAESERQHDAGRTDCAGERGVDVVRAGETLARLGAVHQAEQQMLIVRQGERITDRHRPLERCFVEQAETVEHRREHGAIMPIECPGEADLDRSPAIARFSPAPRGVDQDRSHGGCLERGRRKMTTHARPFVR